MRNQKKFETKMRKMEQKSIEDIKRNPLPIN